MALRCETGPETTFTGSLLPCTPKGQELLPRGQEGSMQQQGHALQFTEGLAHRVPGECGVSAAPWRSDLVPLPSPRQGRERGYKQSTD